MNEEIKAKIKAEIKAEMEAEPKDVKISFNNEEFERFRQGGAGSGYNFFDELNKEVSDISEAMYILDSLESMRDVANRHSGLCDLDIENIYQSTISMFNRHIVSLSKNLEAVKKSGTYLFR